jgi:hypothetical protein
MSALLLEADVRSVEHQVRDGPKSDIGAYSITSSAVAIRVLGTVKPNAFAVLILTTRSNFVDSMTGKSPGLVPFRIRPV